MRHEQRTVHPDFSDVQLDGRFYRVDQRYRRDPVEVWYDPFSLSDTVQIYSLDGEYLGKGRLHQRQRGEEAEPSSVSKPRFNYLDLLVREHEGELRKATEGIDYRKVLSQRGWPFHAFAKCLAHLLGRKGGVSGFNAGELETLRKIFNRHPGLSERLVEEAVERARDRTLPSIAYELQKLSGRKDP